jgi:hypothetical protein
MMRLLAAATVNFAISSLPVFIPSASGLGVIVIICLTTVIEIDRFSDSAGFAGFLVSFYAMKAYFIAACYKFLQNFFFHILWVCLWGVG